MCEEHVAQENVHECGDVEAHPCPYAQDVHGDNESLCYCCPDCEYECAMDI